MFRLTNSFRNLNITIEAFAQTNSNLQSLRWRKPRWIPIAKSKIFKVPKKTVIPQEETEEIRRLFNNYRTQMKSIRRYLTYKYAVRLTAKTDTELQAKEIAEDLQRCNQLNDEWNAEQKKIREERVQKMAEEELNEAKKKLEEQLELQQQRYEEAEKIVKEQKELSSTFITRENINEAIEKALASPVDYNYAVDLDGNKIVGRETIPEEKEKISIKQ